MQEYHNKIAERLEIRRDIRDLNHNPRMYVYKVVPFTVRDNVYYEIVLTPAYDTTSKFDRFVCYSKIMVPSHYSAKMDIYYESVEANGKRMPINILTDYMVSIRPCELNNFARIFGKDIKISPTHSEYAGMMMYLSNSGASLLDVVMAQRQTYAIIKQKMFGRSQVHHFEEVLGESRRLILAGKAGSNIIGYLLHTLNNKVLKTQWNSNSCWKLSDLYLQWGCIPFDEKPFATSLVQHNPESSDLFESIRADGREHELLARYVLSNMSTNARLYTPIKEIEEYTTDIPSLVEKFNNALYSGHVGRKLEQFRQSIFVRDAYNNTKKIIENLQEASKIGLQGHKDAITAWMEETGSVNSGEKYHIFRRDVFKITSSLGLWSSGNRKNISY